MREMDAIWLLPAIVVVAVLLVAYYVGIEVGKDTDMLAQGFRVGREVGHREALDALMRAPASIYDQVVDDLERGIYRCKCHASPFTSPHDRDNHEAFIDSVGGPAQEARWTEAPW